MALEDFFAGLQEKWEGLLQWSDEKGLPFRGWNDALESHGVPALPVFVAVILAILLGVFFLLGAPLMSPASAPVKIKVFADGAGAEGVEVILKADGKQVGIGTTNAKGEVSFADVPVGEVQVVTAYSLDFKPAAESISVESGQPLVKSISLERVLQSRVVLSVEVSGPPSANIYLFTAGKKTQFDPIKGLSASFEVDANAEYVVRAEATGYYPEERNVSVSTTNVGPITLQMLKEGEVRKGTIRVGVFDDRGEKGVPIANATVIISANASEAALATLQTDVEGVIDPQQIQVGATISILASATGYLSQDKTIVVGEGSNSIAFKLSKKTADNSKSIAVSIVTGGGDPISSPTVRLYCAGKKIDEKVPSSGTTSFDAPSDSKCLVTAYKEGYLPTSKTVLPKSESTLALQLATKTNSAELNVKVVDANGFGIPAAKVALFNSTNSAPIGIPEKNSGLDGTLKFADLPFGFYSVVATSGNSEGSAKAEVKKLEEGDRNYVEVTVNKLPGTANVKVIDYYSNASISGALVTIVDSNGSSQSCTTVAGLCTVQAKEGAATITVKSGGYDEFTSTLSITGGATTDYAARLMSSQVSASVKLVFLGLYDAKGKPVKTLAPATTYTARYLMRAPALPFSSAEALVVLGSETNSVEEESAAIVDYSAVGATTLVGQDFSDAADFSPEDYTAKGENATATATQAATTTATASPTATAAATVSIAATVTATANATSNTSLVTVPTTKYSSSDSAGSKWVLFSFPQFNGTRELSVKIKTKAVDNGKVEFNHRSAFVTDRGVLRDPVDENAGTTKAPLLATTSASAAFEISFAGECVNDLCVQAYLEGGAGKGDSIEALIPETLKLRFKVISASSDATVTLSTESNALQLMDGVAGTAKATAKAVAADEVQELSLKAKTGVSGVFTIKTKSVSKDGALSFSVQSGDGSYEKVFSVRISSPSKILKVSIKPERVWALQENKVTFKVTDAFNNPISNARVSMGGDEDALGESVEAVAEDLQGKRKGLSLEGTYVIEKVTPINVGEINWQVEVEGYKLKTGVLPVSTKKIVEVEPKSITVSVEQDEKQNQGTSFRVKNLLDSEVRVEFNAIPDAPTQYTEFKVAPNPIVTLKAKEERDFSLLALPKSTVLTISQKQGQLTEKVTGNIQVIATLQEARQEDEIKFSSNAVIRQSALSELVEFSEDSLDFLLDAPKTTKEEQKLSITNNAPYPILVNRQSLLENVKITPLSLTIAPGATGEFTVTATLPKESKQDKCVIEDTSKEGDAEFYASYQGTNVTKIVKLKVDLTASSRCYIDNGLVFNLPVPIVFKFPVGTKIRNSPADDGSIPAQLPNGEKIVFFQGSSMYGGYAAERTSLPGAFGSGASVLGADFLGGAAVGNGGTYPYYPYSAAAPYYRDPTSFSGASVTQNTQVSQQQAVVPAGTGFVMASKFSSNLGAQDPRTQASQLVTVSFPTVVFIELPGDAVPVQDPMGVRYNLRNAYVVIPANIPVLRAQTYGVIAQVPAMTPVIFGRSGSDLGEIEFSFDQETYIDLPSTAVAQQVQGGIKANWDECTRLDVVTKDGKGKYTTPAAKGVLVEGATLTGTGKRNRITVPAGAKIHVYSCLDVSAEEQKLLSVTLRDPVTIILPPGYRGPPSRYTVEFDSCMPLQVKSRFSLGISAVRKIIFPSTAKGKEVKSGDQTLYQVSMAEGETVSFLPCDAGGKVSVTSYGDYFSVTPSNLSVTLSDSKKTAKLEVCLYNTGSELLQPFDDSHYVESIVSANDQTTFSSMVSKENIYFADQLVGKSTNLQLAFENKKCNKMIVQVQLPTGPNDWVNAFDCVQKEGFLTGYINFRAKNSRGWNGAAFVAVNITIQKDRNGCELEKIIDVKNSLHSFFVNYANDLPNERTKKQMSFNFKGAEQVRYLTLVNNLLEPVTITTNLEDASAPITCEFPTQMQPSEARLVKCTSKTSNAGGMFLLQITATGGTMGNQTIKNVEVTVYSPADEAYSLYQSSPLGDLAPAFSAPAVPAAASSAPKPTNASQEKASDISFEDAKPPADAAKPPASAPAAQPAAKAVSTDSSFLMCEKFFCDATQAQSAYRSFLLSMKSYLDSITKTPETHQRFCQGTLGKGGDPSDLIQVIGEQTAPGKLPGVIEKTIVIQKVAASQSIDEFNQALLAQTKEVLKDYGSYDGGNLFQGIPSGKLSGCGWYKVSVALDACKELGSQSSADWKKRVGLRVQIEPMPENAECLPTLANAPLYLKGNSPDSLGITAGNRIAVWPKELSLERLKRIIPKSKENWDKVTWNPVTWLALFDVGVFSLGPYSNEADANDTLAAKNLYTLLYGQQEKNAAKGTRYENRDFCSYHGWRQLGTVGAVGVGVTGISALTFFIPGAQVASGFFAYLGTKLAIAGATTLALCGGTVAGEAISEVGDKGSYCNAFNGCIRSAIFGASVGGLTTSAQLATGRAIATRAGFVQGATLTGVTAGLTTATNFLAPDGPESTDATVPLVASGYAIGQTARTIRMPTPAGATSRATAIVDDLVRQGILAENSELGRRMIRLIEAGGTAPNAAFEQAFRQLVTERQTAISNQWGGVLTPRGTPTAGQAALIPIQRAHNLVDRSLNVDLVQRGLGTALTAEENLGAAELARQSTALGTTMRDGNLLFYRDAAIARWEAARAAGTTYEFTAADKALFPTRFGPDSVRVGGIPTTPIPTPVTRTTKIMDGAKTLGQVAATLLFEVDVRPVKASLDPALQSHFVAYHMVEKSAGDLPTIYKVCVEGKKLPGAELDADGCVKKESFELSTLCTRDYAACLYRAPVTTLQPGESAYTLITAVNDEKIDSNKLFKSVFTYDEAPMNLVLKGGSLGENGLPESVALPAGGPAAMTGTGAGASGTGCDNIVVAAIGDSITNGRNYLAVLKEKCPTATFEKYAIDGDHVPNIRARLQSDVLSKEYGQVIIQGGLNDICGSADKVKQELGAMYSAAKAAGLRVITLTMHPWKGATNWRPECQTKLEDVNAWIRSKPNGVDVVVDMYALFSDPSDPEAMRSEFVAADKLHPNAQGQRALSQAIYDAAYGGAASSRSPSGG